MSRQEQMTELDDNDGWDEDGSNDWKERGVTVTLTDIEVKIAILVGTERREASLSDGRGGAHGYDRADPLATDIDAAAAEMALARVTNNYWG